MRLDALTETGVPGLILEQSVRRTAPAICARVFLLALLLAALQGCYHYRVAASGPAGANPATFARSATLHDFLWGLVQDESLASVCAQDEALARVRTTSNFGYTLLTMVTLGMWAPVRIEYECANPTPETGTIGTGRGR